MSQENAVATPSVAGAAPTERKKPGFSVIKTVEGEPLMFKMNGPNNIVITDEMGDMANITIYDVLQSNGVIHSIDKVLLPKS